MIDNENYKKSVYENFINLCLSINPNTDIEKLKSSLADDFASEITDMKINYISQGMKMAESYYKKLIKDSDYYKNIRAFAMANPLDIIDNFSIDEIIDRYNEFYI